MSASQKGSIQKNTDHPKSETATKTRRRDWRHDHDHCVDDGEKERRKGRLHKHWREWQRLNERKGRVWTPWLVIRYALQDLGLRPIPAGQKYWLSPDVWVESNDPMGRAIAGEDNFVHTRIFNLGKAPSVPTRVDFYWADPSIGLAAEHMNLIGTEWVQVEAHSAADVRCNTPWVPVLVNGGHECLKVNCTNPLLDPIHHPFQPKVDRHVGQRNITVIQGAAGDTFQFSLAINNIFAIPLTTSIFAQVEHLRVDLKTTTKINSRHLPTALAAFGEASVNLKQELKTRFVKGARDYRRAEALSAWLPDDYSLADAFGISRTRLNERSGTCLQAKWSEATCNIAPGIGAGSGATLLSPSELAQPDFLARQPLGFQLGRIELDSLQQRQLELAVRVPANGTPGEYVVIHLEQWAAGVLAGGYTIVVEIR